MGYLEALLYGLVQGITEYLPVSSSAHLILLPKFLHHEDPGLTFDVFLHLGTLMATLIYFWGDWKEMLRPSKWLSGLRDPEGPSLRNIALATIPALFFGALLHSRIENTFRGEGIIVFTQMVGALALYLADRYARSAREVATIGQKDSIMVGLFQCLSLLPGMSRSGSTMTGARVMGFSRTSAARFSFLMSMPITAAAVLFELRHFRELFASPVGLGPLLTAGIGSFVFGLLSIGVLLRALGRFSFLGFAVYRVGLAVLVYVTFRPF